MARVGGTRKDGGDAAWPDEGAPAGNPESLGHAELRDAMEAVDEAVVIFGERGDVLFMNPAARRLHGWQDTGVAMSRDEYFGRYEARWAGGALVPAAERPLSRALRGEAARNVELHVRDVQSGRGWIGLYAAVPLVSSEGRTLVTVTIRDITERRRAFDALREADRRKDEFLAVLSHELRNPLAPIRSAVFVLEHADDPGGERARRARQVVARQVGHLVRLVDDLLDVTRIARGRIELHRALVDLGDLVRRAGEDHRALLGAAGIDLDVRTPPEPVPVDADPTRLAQLLGNLLQNSAKFTPRGGKVALALARAGSRAEVRVADNGVGIDAALIGNVFEPFVQGERTLARSRGGLGLGLPLVKGLAELHGGSVEASSAGPGRGAEMIVRLPLAGGEEQGAQPPGDAEAPPAHRRVLVVDDNQDAAASLADVVAFLGHSVEAVHDGRTAVERARETHPDVVLCDLGLPGMDGFEVAREIRSDASLAGVRLVAVSGYARPEDRSRAASAGFDAHVAKPADPAAIGRLLT